MTSSMIGGKAAMLDRDGTLIPDRTYTNDPADVTLLPGAAEAIRLLATHGYPSVVITNQSGIARGLVTLAQYRAVVATQCAATSGGKQPSVSAAIGVASAAVLNSF